MPTTRQKAQEFTASGTFNVPPGVEGVWLTMVGGGAGGCSAYQIAAGSGSPGGAAGELRIRFPTRVTPGDAIAVVIGAGGVKDTVAHVSSTEGGTVGGDTSFGDIVALGGRGITAGGGPRGGASGTSPIPRGVYGEFETPTAFAGSGGGVGGAVVGVAPGNNGNAGQGSGGQLTGGAGGAYDGVYGGGGGGAATPWGPGGAGGRGNGLGGSAHGAGGNTGGNPPITNGVDAPAGSYGAGGGGAGACYAAYVPNPIWGGAGAPGYCLVEWYEEDP